MKSLRVGLCLLSLVWASAACVGDNDDISGSREVHPSAQASSRPSSFPSLTDRGPAISIGCSAGATVPSPGGSRTLDGVATSFFGWKPGDWREASLNDIPTMTLWGRTYYQVKSPISVFKGASAKTQIGLLSPASARLYYTDWATWSKLGENRLDQSGVISKSASTVVSVPQCGLQGWTIPGMLLLEGPTCVRFRVAGQEAGSQVTLTVPFFRDRC